MALSLPLCNSNCGRLVTFLYVTYGEIAFTGRITRTETKVMEGAMFAILYLAERKL